MTLFQHHCLMLQVMCTLAEKLCFHVQSQKQKSMFRLNARLIWNHDIRRKSLFAYLHDKGVLDDWTIEKTKNGYSFSRSHLIYDIRLSVTDVFLNFPDPDLGADWSLQWWDASQLRWLRPGWPEPSHCSCWASKLQTSGNCPQPRPGPAKLSSTHYAFIIWFRWWQGQWG